MKAHELLAQPESWTQNVYARDGAGMPVPEDSRMAVCWCVSAAIRKCYPGDGQRRAFALLGRRLGGGWLSWNDRQATQHADVLAVLRELDI